MMRILQLIDQPGPQGEPTGLALAAAGTGRLSDAQATTLMLGPRTWANEASRLGLAVDHVIQPPMAHAVAGVHLLRRWLNGRDEPFDLVHAWSARTLTLAALALPRVTRMLYLVTMPQTRQTRWLRIVTREAPGTTHIFTVSNTIRRELLSHGLPEQRVHVLRPALDQSRIEHSGREALRERWGGDRSTRIVALLSDPPRVADARHAAIVTAMTDEALRARGLRLKLLIHPHQKHRQTALHTMRSLDRAYRIVDDMAIEQPWRALPACDLALACEGAGEGLSLLWAMACGLPIVGEASYGISELLEDRHSALLAKPGRRDVLARRIDELITDRELTWRLRDTARNEAFSFFSRQRYCEHLLTVYRQLMAREAVEVPPLPTTGGLRFAGRA